MPAPVAASWRSENVDFRGYAKYLQTALVQSQDDVLTDSLVHNRLNLRAYLPRSFTLGVEARNRLFYGDSVRRIPGYGDLVTEQDGVLDLEILWVDGDALVLNTVFDRLWLDWSGSAGQARIGRQRINWGMNPVWNPNDVFNAFDYLDFDYEERPGSDAVRLEWFTGEVSSIDLAWKWAADRDDDVAAARFRTNRRGYDLQALAGRFRQDWTVGAGWAGNVRDAGLKGEVTGFFPSSDAPDTASTVVSLTSTLEYSFRGGWTGLASYLLNSGGTTEPGPVAELLLWKPDAKSLLPARHTVFAGGYRQFTPRVYLMLSGFYSFGVNWLVFFPTFTYSIETNWDLDLVGQLFWAESESGAFGNEGNACFLRLKWSF
jgi:hypothetical protein